MILSSADKDIGLVALGKCSSMKFDPVLLSGTLFVGIISFTMRVAIIDTL